MFRRSMIYRVAILTPFYFLSLRLTSAITQSHNPLMTGIGVLPGAIVGGWLVNRLMID